VLRVCRVFLWVRHGSSRAEKWTSVSPWMEGLAQAILSTLPPDAVDRQRLLECLGNAEKNRKNGAAKPCSNNP